MDNSQRSSSNELILSPGEYAFLQDNTKGNVQTFVGPIVVTQTGQLRPVRFENGRFSDTSLQTTAVQCVSARKGEYLILHNPTVEENGLKHPIAANNNTSVPNLRHGEKIVVPGPVEFPLWPQQQAEMIKGHSLRNDQFLIVTVYDEDAAVANWSDATVVSIDEGEDAVTSKTPEELGLTLGQLLIIKGVSFYIPSTGIEVVHDDKGRFIRDALTLEMSEYAILVDQSGNKRYEKGPQIVFPAPTEEFFSDGNNIKFKPIELTATQGLHLKVNCEYTDAAWSKIVDGKIVTSPKTFEEGQELFITGLTHPIYYPCEEQSIIRYGDNLIHYATAVPSGQARYVMDKNTGEITTIEGPNMILLDPTTNVFVQRVLSDNETLLMYPGNTDSLEYNRSLRQFQVKSGVEGETLTSSLLSANYEVLDDANHDMIRCATSRPQKRQVAGEAAFPDQIQRATQYTKPHSVTFDDNRFNGVPTLKIWTGYAVLLVRANGDRRVELGPKTVKLEYDETVQGLHLSTGKPKTTDDLLTTGYLEISNVKVGDIISVETADGVRVQLKVSYRMSFGGDKTHWFNVDNPVKLLCDHARSRLKGIARQHTVRSFYKDTVDIVRDTILGERIDGGDRKGLLFDENGMHLTELDLLGVEIADETIGHLLVQQQQAVITDQIAIDRTRQQFNVDKADQEVEKAHLQLKDDLRIVSHALEQKELADQAELADFRAKDHLQRAEESVILAAKFEEAKTIESEAQLERDTAQQALQIADAKAATEQVVTRFKAAEGDFAAAIRELGDEQVLTKVAEAMGPMRLIGGGSLTDVLAGIIGGVTGNNGLVNRLATLVDTQSNGS